MIHSHPTADVGVLVPLHRTGCEGLLRSHDFLEQGVISGFLLENLRPDLQLLLQDRIRRLVELDLVFGLQFNVVLGITV